MSEIAYGPRDRQGPKEPYVETPARVPGSIRRTTTLDGLHPDGPDGPLLLVLRARDLLTDLDSTAREVGRTVIRMRVGSDGVLDVDAEPGCDEVGQLLGHHPSVGWSKLLADVMPDQAESRTLVHLVLDALPAWLSLAIFGLSVAGDDERSPQRAAPTARNDDPATRVDICAGWQAGGTIVGLTRSGHLAAEFLRPDAPPLESSDDPLAWHDCDPLPPFASRRCRRIDLVDGGLLRIDGMFRDTVADANRVEGVLHEYTVAASVDPGTMEVVDSSAVPRVLPYQECPQAAGSARQLVGRDVRGMRRFVRSTMRGTTTCTHLNELYRTFGDVDALAGQLRLPTGTAGRG